MNQGNLSYASRKVVLTTCFMVFGLGIFYAIITMIGLLTLKSPNETIADPYFTIMEILSILIALLMAVSMVGVHYFANGADRYFSLTALILIFIATGITSSVHFVILSLNQTAAVEQLPDYSFFYSFRWPSVVYALDILAWDLFFGLSMLFASQVFKDGRLERALRTILIICGVFSLAGLIGVPLQNMQIRNIGIIGYAVLGPVAFLLMGRVIGSRK
ncbi:hypothetical protein [Flavihumibacter sp.]|uniref:hypothetical protein n=1 Tax=Flavihumibacter sp. TaxID=1913981 RepID=UPI002FCB77F5